MKPGEPIDIERIFEVLPTPYVVLSTELVMIDMNQAYLAAIGRTRAEILGRPILEAFPPPADSLDEYGRSELQISLEKVRDTGRPDTLPVQIYPISGSDGVMTERHWLAVHVPVLDDDGRVSCIVQRTEDITEFSMERRRIEGLAARHDHDAQWQRRAERVEADLFSRARELTDALAERNRAARHASGLAEVALALTSAQSVGQVEQIVVGRGLTVLGAEGGAVVTAADDGGWRLAVNATLGEQVQATYGHLPYDSPLPAIWTARCGERLLLPTRASGLAFSAQMATVYADTQRLGWAFAPLIVDEVCLGSLAASWVDEHELTADELDLLAGFAAQCAQALQRIALAETQRASALEVRQLAEALQQAMLTPPPQPDHLQIAVRYTAAGHESQVGGDWYDAFVQPDGLTTLVIGDVVGHDSAAAAKMGQLRALIRSLAYRGAMSDRDEGPAEILTRAEHTSRGLDVDVFATTVLVRIEAEVETSNSHILRWANAGHMPPVVVHADTTVQLLDVQPDLMLGVQPDAPRRDHVTELPIGSTLLLYTDGLIERRGVSLDVGLATLAEQIADLGAVPLEELCDRLLQRMRPQAGEDDIALIALRAY